MVTRDDRECPNAAAGRRRSVGEWGIIRIEYTRAPRAWKAVACGARGGTGGSRSVPPNDCQPVSTHTWIGPPAVTSSSGYGA